MIAMIARAHACAAAGPQTEEDIDRQRDTEQELAFEMAMTDLSEKDHAGAGASAAAARLKAAAGELVRATLALIGALVGRLLLANAAEAVARRTGKRMVGAERSVLAMEKLLQSFFWRSVVGRRRLLALFGARISGEEAATTRRLKLATRNYRSGQKSSGLGYAVAADAPTVHVMLGVSVMGKEKPIYRVRRFVEAEQGGFSELGGFHSTDAAEAFVEFLASPELAQLTAVDEEEDPQQYSNAAADNDGGNPQTAA